MGGDGRAPARVGVLALQGGFRPHVTRLTELGLDAREIRRPAALGALDGLVLPGGESTTMLHHFESDPSWWSALSALHARGCPMLGTCAGVILLAREVTDPPQRSFGFLDVTVRRNAYGRQVDSFCTEGRWHTGEPLPMIFIRAPVVTRVGEGVRVLAWEGDRPVLLQEGVCLAATFHPELTADPAVHERFRGLVEVAATRGVT